MVLYNRTALPLVDTTYEPLFDFTYRGQRRCTYNFWHVDAPTGLRDGVRLYPIKGSNPVLTHDTTRSIKRTLSFMFDRESTAIWNHLRSRVDVEMETEDGRTWPLGRYMSADWSRVRSTGGRHGSPALVDESFVVNQPIDVGFTTAFITSLNTKPDRNMSVNGSVNVFLDRYTLFNPDRGRNAIAGSSAMINDVGVHIIQREIESSPFAMLGSWHVGTNGMQVLDALAVAGDYWSPWISSTRRFKLIRQFDPAERVPSFDFDTWSVVIRDSIVETDDLINAPNRIIVTDNSGSTTSRVGPVVGTYDVPAAAPWSIENRGFVVPAVYNVPVTTSAQAEVIARNIGERQQIFERVTLNTVPDPRHESYDVILWDGKRWLELAWSLPLSEGAPMTHTLRRIYD